MSEAKLSGRVAVITGASKGLGKSMALALGAAGANIVHCKKFRREAINLQTAASRRTVQTKNPALRRGF